MVKLNISLFLILLLSLLVFDNEVITCASLSHFSSSNLVHHHHHHHLCIHNEKAALLQFKHLFVMNPPASRTCSSNRSKFQSWSEENHTTANRTSGDCCSWEGVECDVLTGHVIGLDLNCGLLYGAIPSNSTLFQLSHLRKLDLSLNNFNGSSISPAFGRNFPHLTHLALSASNFSGIIPSEIAHLSKLISLTIQPFDTETLRLEQQSFKMLIENLTRLESLDLSGVNISSIPQNIGNLSSLTDIDLSFSELYGNLPNSMFQLPKLQEVDLRENDGLVGYLPNSNWNCTSSLLSLTLSKVRFSSKLPDSLSPGCLKRIEYLDLSNGGLFGYIPPWLGNLTEIQIIDLSGNSLTGQVPFTLSNLKSLYSLDLSESNLEGEIPNAFAQLPFLSELALKSNSFHGKLPHWLKNLTKLDYLDLSSNKLTGPIPSNLSELKNLRLLSLSDNSFDGAIPLGLFALQLYELNLGSNQLSGTIPSNLTGLQFDCLTIDLSNNNLSGNLGPLTFVNLTELSWLFISGNEFHGDIPPSICDLSMLEILDMSHNNLSGVIPKCISTFSDSLSVMNLGMNRLSGTIQLDFAKGSLMRSINLNGNHLEGQVPRSLANCTDLEILDLGNNKIHDIFPYWLESIPQLQVLVLRHNKFHGTVGYLGVKNLAPFPKLQIFDLSHNEFIGPLPTNYFQSLNAMRNVNRTQSTTLEYMGNTNYDDTVVITWKGVEFEVQHILKVLATIDFSGNRFEGEIPNDMGSLIGIQSLNLSNNVLTGLIPSSLANLRLLESLDLSSNQLSGVIPQELTHITTLEVLNLSSNHLTGPIPQGLQFNTFQNDSYSGNLGLCGPPLSKKCSDNGKPHDQPSLAEDDDEGGIFDGFGWKVVLLGYGCGTLFGLGVGFVMFSTGKPKRLVTFVEEELMRITKGTGKRDTNHTGPRRGTRA